LLVGIGLFVFTGCQSPRPLIEPLVARFYMETHPNEAGAIVQLPVSKARISVNPKPVLVEYDIVGVDIVKVELGWCLQFTFTPAAARDLYRLSATNQGRRLVLTFNDTAIGVRRLDQAMTTGSLLIFVELPNEDLPSLVDRIRRTSEGLQARAK
jgi:hypothetical protein